MGNPTKTQDCQLITAAELANLLCLTKRQVYRLKSRGKIPASIRIGGSVRWKLATVDEWISMDCPDRKEFEARINRSSR